MPDSRVLIHRLKSFLGSWCRRSASSAADTIQKSARPVATNVPGLGRDRGGAGGESGVRPIRGKHCEHNWRYYEDEDNRPYTGYLERCERCGLIEQVVQ